MLKTIFWGTPDFSVPTLDALKSNPNIEISMVISNPDRKSGRGQKLHSPPVIQYAKENSINFFQTENINKEESFIKKLKTMEIDIFIVLAFSQFLKKDLLSIPKIGSFNIHTSLLPRYRGAAPIQYALLNGDTVTGVSIQKMVSKMDAGDVCYSKEVPIESDENGKSLYEKLKLEAASSIDFFIEDVLKNNIKYTPQDEKKVSFAPTISKKDGHIDFSNISIRDLQNKIKAFHPWPGTFSYLNGKLLKVFEVAPSSIKLNPGEVSTEFQTLNIGCSDGSVRITKLQLEGKKPTSDSDLLNGLRETIKIG